MRVLTNYWNAIAETCLFLKQNKNEELVKSYQGHLFSLIPREDKLSALRDHIRKKEREYAMQKKLFLEKL
jgi:hypothetical protein